MQPAPACSSSGLLLDYNAGHTHNRKRKNDQGIENINTTNIDAYVCFARNKIQTRKCLVSIIKIACGMHAAGLLIIESAVLKPGPSGLQNYKLRSLYAVCNTLIGSLQQTATLFCCFSPLSPHTILAFCFVGPLPIYFPILQSLQALPLHLSCFMQLAASMLAVQLFSLVPRFELANVNSPTS